MTSHITINEGPGKGPGWDRLAAALRENFPCEGIDAVWTFRVVRREGRDFGTAVLSRLEQGRRRIYTAQFVHTVKGQQRGGFEWSTAEVGSGPPDALDELLALVPRRAADEEPPVPIDPVLWFPKSSSPE